MHYYKFSIGDYASHTAHLDPMEDIAYRRMLDWHYLHESALPESVEQIARLIRMRTHCEEIANVLREFFTLGEFGWEQPKAVGEIESYRLKSEKAKKSAEARWASKPIESNANALRTECEGNANHKPLTTNQEPLLTLSPAATSCPCQKIADAYNKSLPQLPQVASLSAARKKALKARWRSNSEYQSLEWWTKFFLWIGSDNPFLLGSDGKWQANFDWIIKESNFLKIVEGNYFKEQQNAG